MNLYRLWVAPSAGDPERFGTVLAEENGWTLIAPFNEGMAKRAVVAGAIEAETPEAR